MTRMFLFLYLLGIVSSIVTVPNWKGAHMYGNAPWELFADLFVLCALVCLIPRHLLLHRLSVPLQGIVRALIYIVMYPLYIVDTFCFVKFGATLNPTMLLLMEETTTSEASEFLNSYVNTEIILSEVGIIILIPLIHAITAIVWTRVKWFRRFALPKADSKMSKAIYIALDAIVLGLLVFAFAQTIENKQLMVRLMSHDTIGKVEHDLTRKPHAELYQPPYRLAFSVYSNRLVDKQVDRLREHVGNVVVDSCDVKSPNIVLILGESYNKRHSQLYGYDKRNTPHQRSWERRGYLIKMNDAVAPWNLTSYVFKHWMTTYCVGDKGDWCDYPLFCELFRKAGYEVRFFTNQFLPKAKDAVYDFSGGFFLNDSILSRAQFDVRNEKLHLFDDGLLKDYDAIEHKQPALTIFHLAGMHVNYRVRCPNSKKQWKVEDYPNDTDMRKKNIKVMADYDNAVWYNDSVVNQIIERFRGEEAVIIYLPDHGEEVFGPGARHFFGRMHDTTVSRRLADEEFRIPMWIYMSKKYIRKHPEVLRAVRKAKDKKYMSDALSHLLLGLAGIHTPAYRPQYDLLSPQYDENRPRILKGQVDYDKLQLDNEEK